METLRKALTGYLTTKDGHAIGEVLEIKRDKDIFNITLKLYRPVKSFTFTLGDEPKVKDPDTDQPVKQDGI